MLDAEFAAGNRVIAVATREAAGRSSVTPADEHGLTFGGLLVFLDPPKPTARAALQRLARLGVTVKILTGDNRSSRPRSAPTSACRPARWPPAPTSTPRATGSAT